MAVSCRMYPTDTRTSSCEVAYNAIRRMFHLPGRTHPRLLHLIINDLPVNGQIHLRIIN